MPIIILAIVGLVLLAKGTQTPANGKQNTPPPTPPPPPKVDNTTRDVIGGATAILPVAVKVGATIAGATGAGTALAGGGATTVYTVETTGEATGLISETTAETTEVVTISGSTILAAGIFLLFVAAVITTITLYGLDAANALFRYKIVGRTNKGVQLEACNALEMMVLVGYQPTFISPDANQVTAHATPVVGRGLLDEIGVEYRVQFRRMFDWEYDSTGGHTGYKHQVWKAIVEVDTTSWRNRFGSLSIEASQVVPVLFMVRKAYWEYSQKCFEISSRFTAMYSGNFNAPVATNVAASEIFTEDLPLVWNDYVNPQTDTVGRAWPQPQYDNAVTLGYDSPKGAPGESNVQRNLRAIDAQIKTLGLESQLAKLKAEFSETAIVETLTLTKDDPDFNVNTALLPIGYAAQLFSSNTVGVRDSAGNVIDRGMTNYTDKVLSWFPYDVEYIPGTNKASPFNERLGPYTFRLKASFWGGLKDIYVDMRLVHSGQGGISYTPIAGTIATQTSALDSTPTRVDTAAVTPKVLTGTQAEIAASGNNTAAAPVRLPTPTVAAPPMLGSLIRPGVLSIKLR